MEDVSLVIWERAYENTRITEFCNVEWSAEISIVLLTISVHYEYFLWISWFSLLVFVKLRAVKVRVLN